MALTFGSNQCFVAERREPPGEYPSDLTTVTGQLALFRYKVSTIWLAPNG